MSDESGELREIVRDVGAYVEYLRQIGDCYLSAGPARTSLESEASPFAAADSIEAEGPGSGGIAEVERRDRKEEGTVPDSGETPSLFGDEPLSPAGDETLDEIRNDLGECIRCKLHEHRTNIVFGEGAAAADLMFVGEGPGADEDATGRPFVGAAGQLLDKIIGAIGLTRDQVYIANVVKCRPPGNRKPEKDESSTCEPFLYRQIATIKPKVIVVLGNTPLESLLNIKGGITRVRGTFYDYNGIKVMPTFHPAYLLRDPRKKREVWDDMKKVREELNRA